MVIGCHPWSQGVMAVGAWGLESWMSRWRPQKVGCTVNSLASLVVVVLATVLGYVDIEGEGIAVGGS